MSKYTIRFTQSARKELEALEKSIVHRIFPKIEMLATDPRPSGCRKLHGEENLWRIRVGDYRVIYDIYDTDHLLSKMLKNIEAYSAFGSSIQCKHWNSSFHPRMRE